MRSELLQKVAARHRLPKARDYRTHGFVAFTGGKARVPTTSGAYACAIRFVRAATGEAIALVPLDVIQVA